MEAIYNLLNTDQMINILLTIVLLVITWNYTKATQKIKRLEEERKVWDVKPIVKPFKKFDNDKQYYVYGIKNVGRGVAGIDYLKIDLLSPQPTKKLERDNNYEDREDHKNNKQIYELIFPIYLGVMEELVYTRTIGNAVKVEDQLIQIAYADIHGNMYYTSLKNKKIVTGKGILPKNA